MKLIYCHHCGDIVRLRTEPSYCRCDGSWGYYADGLHATYGGSAMPIGFDNNSFNKALSSQPDNGMGSGFTAFVIPKKCPTFKRE